MWRCAGQADGWLVWVNGLAGGGRLALGEALGLGGWGGPLAGGEAWDAWWWMVMGVRVRVEDCGGGGWCCRVIGVASGSVLFVGEEWVVYWPRERVRHLIG